MPRILVEVKVVRFQYNFASSQFSVVLRFVHPVEGTTISGTKPCICFMKNSHVVILKFFQFRKPKISSIVLPKCEFCGIEGKVVHLVKLTGT